LAPIQNDTNDTMLLLLMCGILPPRHAALLNTKDLGQCHSVD
jgi:hypothetical protein